jgi:hypothetical protein
MTLLKGLDRDKVWFRYGFENLLIWLFLYLVVSPFIEGIPFIRVIIDILFGAVLLFAVTAMNRESRMLTPAIILLALTFTLYFLEIFGVINFSLQGLLVTKTLYYFILVCSFTRYIFSRKSVDSHLICAALCLYLIVGLMWGGMYHLLESVVSNSFSGVLIDNADSFLTHAQHFNYFSFITMTTLGYGDITPQTNAAASLCQAQAILGQFFSVVLIARLVGIQVAQEFSPNKE